MQDKLRLGVIGFGTRGQSLLKQVLLPMSELDIELYGVCDSYDDRAREAARLIEEKCGKKPACTTDYREILDMDIDAVIILSSWESHVAIAVEAMNAGKQVGLEVGGAYAVEDCWQLVHTAERTGKNCMLLENCCYDKRELMVLNMVKQGVFGDVVFCEGGYHHDLRHEILFGEENRHYRLRNYIHRNCENYPTHELGPIAKILNINNGNRMLWLTSAASCAKGLREYARIHRGPDDRLSSINFAQGDIVKTTIACAGGELISLTLDTTLPRAYSRGFTVRGTKAAYFEDNDSFFIDDSQGDKHYWTSRPFWGNAKEYEERYQHPLWRNYEIKGGHGGIDWLVLRAFVEAVMAGVQTPIDVYDTAAWMCVSVLSEQSIAAGGAPQPIPDFTRGRWMCRKDIVPQKYQLHLVADV